MRSAAPPVPQPVEDEPFDQDAPDPAFPASPSPPRPLRGLDLARLRPYSGRHRAPHGTPRDRGLRSTPGATVPRRFGFWDHRRFVHVGGGEQIAVEVQPSVQAWLPKVPIWLAIAALLGAVAAVSGRSAPMGWITMAGFVALFSWVGVRLARWRLAWYVVTNKRAMRVEGVWRRQAFTVPLDRITDVTYEQTWIEDKLNVGTVRVLSANEDSLVRELRSVPRPDEFFRRLWELVNRSKMGLLLPAPTTGPPQMSGPHPAGPHSSGWDGAVPQPWDATTPQVPVSRHTLEF